jgi:hypothetical protein
MTDSSLHKKRLLPYSTQTFYVYGSSGDSSEQWVVGSGRSGDSCEQRAVGSVSSGNSSEQWAVAAVVTAVGRGPWQQ